MKVAIFISQKDKDDPELDTFLGSTKGTNGYDFELGKREKHTKEIFGRDCGLDRAQRYSQRCRGPYSVPSVPTEEDPRKCHTIA